ncbi:MAG: response regulator [Candidatus Omnitrophota bacterium]|nr:response regulator [Candidatus Omnitrophota bacterium]MDZ4243025.1 response regulator [Candidatus Omnitrophota bacterium]
MGNKMNVVVIDDEKDLCSLVRDILEGTGPYEVSMAYDGAQGMEMCAALNPDLVFLDFVMPKMRGDEVVKRLKAPGWSAKAGSSL